jgi:hypothetical protein
MLLGRNRNGRKQILGVAGFSKEAKNLSVVHRCNRGFEVGLSGEEEPDGIRRMLFDQAQEGRTVHFRHAHVGNHHSRWIAPIDDFKSALPIGCSRDPIVSPQIQSQPFQYFGFVIDAQNVE